MNQIRWGILGVARINDRLLPALARARNARLTAIASRSLENARAAATTAGIPRCYGSYDALLADPEIDAVYIPLPNTLHAEWTRKAAEHGKHVLCEKPLAPTAGLAQEVVDFCRSRKVCLMDGFMWPHHPRTARIRQLLDRGVIGDVRRVTGSFTFALRPLDPANIRLRPELAGGSLLDVGCYPVYGIRWAMRAEPVRVFAAAEWQFGVDTSMTGMLWFADGRMASFDCGFTLPLRCRLEIVGSEGIINVPNMWLPPPRASFLVEREGGGAEETVIDGQDQIQHMIEHFGQAVLDGQPVQPDPIEAVRTLRVLDALARSAREGKIVEV